MEQSNQQKNNRNLYSRGYCYNLITFVLHPLQALS